MGLLLRFCSMLMVGAAMVVGAYDAAQTVALSTFTMTSTSSVWQIVSPQTFPDMQSPWRHPLLAHLYESIVPFILLQPAFVVFLGVALVFWIGGHRRKHLVPALPA